MSLSDYRERCLSEKGEECMACGTGDEIVVHHKNGDRTDNALENLVPVCRACHEKIHARSSEVADLVEELGHRPRRVDEHTTIRVSDELADGLFDRKQRGESYEDVIWRLIEEADADE